MRHVAMRSDYSTYIRNWYVFQWAPSARQAVVVTNNWVSCERLSKQTIANSTPFDHQNSLENLEYACRRDASKRWMPSWIYCRIRRLSPCTSPDERRFEKVCMWNATLIWARPKKKNQKMDFRVVEACRPHKIWSSRLPFFYLAFVFSSYLHLNMRYVYWSNTHVRIALYDVVYSRCIRFQMPY